MLLALLLLVTQATSAPVRVEFRVFAGTEEITATTRLRIMPTGTRDQPVTMHEAKRLLTTVTPGIYDVQALRMRPEGIVAIRWDERLVVMHYPDEAGRHLQVINFQDGYGALQIRAAKGSIATYEIVVFPAGDRMTAVEPLQGEDYSLFVLKSGRYDLRVRQRAAEDSRWFLDLEVPANRTRMKIIDGS